VGVCERCDSKGDSSEWRMVRGSVRGREEFGLSSVPHPPVFFVRVAGKGLMLDDVCKSGKCRT
jgi:hypothetical protein